MGHRRLMGTPAFANDWRALWAWVLLDTGVTYRWPSELATVTDAVMICGRGCSSDMWAFQSGPRGQQKHRRPQQSTPLAVLPIYGRLEASGRRWRFVRPAGRIAERARLTGAPATIVTHRLV
jgi:hypothetical protein